MAKRGWPNTEGLPDIPWSVRRSIFAHDLLLTALLDIEQLAQSDQQSVLAQLAHGREAQNAKWNTLVAALADWLKD